MKNTIEVENIKCYGCANTITKSLEKTRGVKKVIVNIENKKVEVDYDNLLINLRTITNRLKKLGYPEIGRNSGLHKAKSYVSCAVGRIKIK